MAPGVPPTIYKHYKQVYSERRKRDIRISVGHEWEETAHAMKVYRNTLIPNWRLVPTEIYIYSPSYSPFFPTIFILPFLSLRLMSATDSARFH